MNNQQMIAHQSTLNMTNKQLARALGVSLYTVIAWRRDPASPSYREAPANLVQLAGFLIAAEKQAARFPHGEY